MGRGLLVGAPKHLAMAGSLEQLAPCVQTPGWQLEPSPRAREGAARTKAEEPQEAEAEPTGGVGKPKRSLFGKGGREQPRALLSSPFLEQLAVTLVESEGLPTFPHPHSTAPLEDEPALRHHGFPNLGVRALLSGCQTSWA